MLKSLHALPCLRRQLKKKTSKSQPSGKSLCNSNSWMQTRHFRRFQIATSAHLFAASSSSRHRPWCKTKEAVESGNRVEFLAFNGQGAHVPLTFGNSGCLEGLPRECLDGVFSWQTSLETIISFCTKASPMYLETQRLHGGLA